jgi:hypothetical protein
LTRGEACSYAPRPAPWSSHSGMFAQPHWYERLLRGPRDASRLSLGRSQLVCCHGHRYPVGRGRAGAAARRLQADAVGCERQPDCGEDHGRRRSVAAWSQLTAATGRQMAVTAVSTMSDGAVSLPGPWRHIAIAPDVHTLRRDAHVRGFPTLREAYGSSAGRGDGGRMRHCHDIGRDSALHRRRCCRNIRRSDRFRRAGAGADTARDRSRSSAREDARRARTLRSHLRSTAYRRPLRTAPVGDSRPQRERVARST